MLSMSLLSITACSVLMFPLMSQPLSLGLSIMISTLLLCTLSAMLISSWYAYILFLIYVGGLLVMFAYVASLSPNMLFSKMNLMLFIPLMLILATYIFYFYNFTDMPSTEFLNNTTESMKMKKYGTEMVSKSYISILIAFGSILLLNLIVVVKICFYQQTSLRPYKN
uniref:NADH-ubiquinone oxidoreductase chain 6 n=1 Tax=Maackia herderiana TaxID=577130 RepID=A0A248RGE2_9CAEN|nr:NADH dehydrogenase subunit 6 [Maackia herderiana]ASU96544.1 NADH dehydrogenase subunit 6 [Maackia herderiana]